MRSKMRHCRRCERRLESVLVMGPVAPVDISAPIDISRTPVLLFSRYGFVLCDWLLLSTMRAIFLSNDNRQGLPCNIHKELSNRQPQGIVATTIIEQTMYDAN